MEITAAGTMQGGRITSLTLRHAGGTVTITPEAAYLVTWPSSPSLPNGSRRLLFGQRIIDYPVGSGATITLLSPVHDCSPATCEAAHAEHFGHARPATEAETSAYLAGYTSPDAVETEHGLMIREQG